MKVRKTLKFYCLVLSIIGGTFLAPLAFALSSLTTLHVKDYVEVSRGGVYLSDIINPASIPSDWVDHFSSIYIGEAPQVGEVKYVQVELLRSYLKKIVEGNGQSFDRVEVIIPSEIVVTRKSTNIPKEEIEQAFRDYVIKHISWNSENIEIKNIKLSGLPVVPVGERVIKVTSESQELTGGNVTLNFQITVDGRPVQSFNVTGLVDLYDNVFHVVKDITRGSILQPQDIVIKRAKVTDDPKGYAKRELDALGKKVLKDFSAGEPLRLSYLDNPVVINKGDIVKLVVSKPGLVLTAKGEAKSDGRIGDRVKVMNISSKRIIQGWVKDKETVIVAE
ncbi:MAG: flagellar basal body P-ring formation chaperone FlgA [Syntrophobacterales bacterium]|nr:flagellar basal body P-ring formation chaperone FlgA [Syntrophobacterales bacterium]